LGRVKTISIVGVAMICAFEALKLTPYRDVVGVWTDGWGNTKNVVPGRVITERKAAEDLSTHVTTMRAQIDRCVKVPLNQNQSDAFISFTYNVGPAAFCRSTLVRKLNAGDYDGACNELSKWVFAGGKRLNGLVKRREQERQLCLKKD